MRSRAVQIKMTASDPNWCTYVTCRSYTNSPQNATLNLKATQKQPHGFVLDAPRKGKQIIL